MTDVAIILGAVFFDGLIIGAVLALLLAWRAGYRRGLQDEWYARILERRHGNDQRWKRLARDINGWRPE
jgi:hypothetical protein